MEFTLKNILKTLRSHANAKSKEHMQRYAINAGNALGVTIAQLRQITKQIKNDHQLALELWDTNIHEARILATLLDQPELVTEQQMENWVIDFDSWDLCDQACNQLFRKTAYAYDKISQWTEREEEYVKRAGFVLMAVMAVHDKQADNKQFESFFPIIIKHASDDRNFVKKAVNWALRQIGKRNIHLNQKAIECAHTVIQLNTTSASWIGKDALRELHDPKVQKRLHGKDV